MRTCLSLSCRRKLVSWLDELRFIVRVNVLYLVGGQEEDYSGEEGDQWAGLSQ